MSAETMGSAPVSGMERDARQVNAHHGRLQPGEISIGVLIGRTAEFFDFFVFAIASVIVFPARVFSNVDPLTGTYYSFAIFALAFLARPVGTVIFTAVHRKYGDGLKLTIALFMLGISTILIGFLPNYETIGAWSGIALAVLRIGQGIALGGTWDGLASLLAINAPENRRGWWAMIPQLGAPLGLIVASGLFAFFLAFLSPEDFLDWGWRYPFFVAFAINVVALFARLRIVATPEYQDLFEKGDLQPTSVFQTIRDEGRFILIGAFAPLASFAMFHMVTVFPLSWIVLFTPEDAGRFLTIELLATFLGLAAHIASGPLADRFGRRTLLGVTAGAIAVFAGIAPKLLDGGETGQVIFMAIGSVILGLCFGQSSGAVASNFSKAHRYTGSALTTDLAWLFGAGFAPLVALFVSAELGLIFSGVYLFSGAVCTLIALRINRRLASRSA